MEPVGPSGMIPRLSDAADERGGRRWTRPGAVLGSVRQAARGHGVEVGVGRRGERKGECQECIQRVYMRLREV